MKAMKSALLVTLLCAGLTGTALAQDTESVYSFSLDNALVSKYIWRGQRLTNDWSLQPSATVGIGGFSFNAWGTMDLTAVNEGDSLPIPENPAAAPGAAGLKGKLSEIDYTFSYAHSFEKASVDFGTIFYTFPERSASLSSTTEIYGGVTFDSIPTAPSAKLFIDVDETGEDAGSTGLYFQLGAGHSVPFNHRVFTGLDISGTLSFANNGFGNFYYGATESGAHDASVTVGLPIAIGENWSAGAFVTYSALLGGFRNYQFRDSRAVYDGTAGTPRSYADTVWGGFTISLGF